MSAAIRIAGAARSAQRVTASDDDRRIGLDAAYEADVDDSTLAVRSAAEQRELLARDRGLLFRRTVYWRGAHGRAGNSEAVYPSSASEGRCAWKSLSGAKSPAEKAQKTRQSSGTHKSTPETENRS
ncbi:hypothetical protein [Microterricola viridarii]|uniref:hypothetical protein n=1 Tax=Microterricola viridarii TaxID=412690 RepID=UPI00101AD14D|nr:hypothetical protein [Microterricola viridarii]